MQLKLSTLVAIIAIIFFAYYYFIYSPCQAASPQPQQLLPPPQEIYPEAGFRPEGVTMLDDGMHENFGVTILDDNAEDHQFYYNPNDIYDLAGNVRPDNVMQVEEPVTLL